jgi:Rieske Fe-S protein
VGGTIQNLAVGALIKISGQNVALGRDSSGVYAMTMICTHQGCPINAPSGGTFSCPCHGSQFDRNGAVVRGPAGRPLNHFAVEIDATGTIIVHTRTTVGANVRVAP